MSAKAYAMWGGIILLVLGVIGLFVGDQFLSIFNTEIVEDLIHLVAGVILVYVAYRGTDAMAASAAQVFGIIFIVVGIVGFFAARLFGLLPAVGLSAWDNILHLLYGVVGLWAGRAYKPAM